MREAIRGEEGGHPGRCERNQEPSGAQSRAPSGAQSRAIRTHLSSGTGFMVLIAGNHEQSGAQSRAIRTYLSSGTGFMVLIAGSVAVYSPPADALTSFSLT